MTAKKQATAKPKRKRASRRVRTEGKAQRIFIGFVVIAIALYFGFRAFGLLEFGQGLVGKFTNDKDPVAICPATTHNDASQITPVYAGISDTLAARFSQNIASANLVQNSSLTEQTSDGYPLHYERAATSQNAILQQGVDSDGTHYLRATLQQNTQDQTGRVWLPEFSALQAGTSYYVRFQYRGSTTSDVTIQYRLADNSFSYQSFGELAAAENWQTFQSRLVTFDTNITGARILINPRVVGSVDVSAMSIFALTSRALAGGMVSIAFDDGRKSVYTRGLPIFDKFGFRTTQYVLPGVSAKADPDYLSFADIADLAKRGHAIESHSYQHCDMTGLKRDQILKDVEVTKKAFQQHNVASPTSFAYPYGAYSPLSQTTLRPNFATIRTSNDGYNDYYTDPQAIMIKSVEGESPTIDLLSTWLNEAKTHNLWLVLLYHQVDGSGEYSVSSERLTAQLEAIKASGLPVLTVPEAAAKIR